MASTAQKPLVIGSRASNLAQIQADAVLKALQAAHPSQAFELKLMTTEGDRNQSQALYLLGGKELWTKDLEVGLLNGSIDMIVHCLKDMPTVLPAGCTLGAITERAEARDSLVVKAGLEFKTLEDMPAGSVIGTSSVRRVALLRRSFPHLEFRDVRGNLNTRLAKLDAEDGPYTALILAAAGLERMGFGNRITALLGPPVMFPAVGQAALGIEIRTNDSVTAEIATLVHHWQTAWACLAERACLRFLEGGCSVPVGVFSTLVPVPSDDTTSKPRAKLNIVGTVTSLDGSTHVKAELDEVIDGEEAAESLGRRLGEILKADGAEAILEDIKKDRAARQMKESVGVAAQEDPK